MDWSNRSVNFVIELFFRKLRRKSSLIVMTRVLRVSIKELMFDEEVMGGKLGSCLNGGWAPRVFRAKPDVANDDWCGTSERISSACQTMLKQSTF